MNEGIPPTAAIALVVYEALEARETDVASLLNHLIGLILDLDVLPFVAILDDVYGYEMEIVIGNLILSDSSTFREREVTHFAIKKIATVGGPGATTEDVVALPEIPVRP
jgi:hypothetical protein